MNCQPKKMCIRDLPVVKQCFCLKDASGIPRQSIRPTRAVGISRVPENPQQRVLSEGASSPAMTAMGLKPAVGWLVEHVPGIDQSDQHIHIQQSNPFGHQAS
ncbi:hypothetical protein N9996_04500 [Synechococcus sp. AH-603-M21]|nr:hypothetical protein [Synechococcus sp. AH-603-M21]